MAPTGFRYSPSFSSLSRLEDEQVVVFARAGCPRATEHLLRKYRRFVEGKARCYFLAGGEQEDMVQEGMIGLFKAIRDFRPDKLARFRSFAEMCVTRQIVTAVKSATRGKHQPLNDYASLQATCGGSEDGVLMMDVLADPRVVDPEQVLLQSGRMRQIRHHAEDELSDLEGEVLEGYLEGRTYQEMAGEFVRPTKAIDNALQRAKRKIGRRLLELN